MKAIVITDKVAVGVCFVLVLLSLLTWWSSAEHYRASYEFVVRACSLSPPRYYEVKPFDIGEVDMNVSVESREDRERVPIG